MTNISAKLIFESAVQNLATSGAAGPTLSPAMMMLQTQMLIAQNYDSQLRDVANKIKFLKDVVSKYHENINKAQTFLAQNSKENSDKKQVIQASPTQAADLLGSLTTLNYNLNDKSITVEGIAVNNIDNKNNLSDYANTDGKINTLELQNFSVDASKITNESEYNEFAKKLSASNNPSQLFIYFNEGKASKGADGKKMFTFYTDQVQKFVDIMNSKVEEIKSEIEELDTKMTDLTEKRKTALDSANNVLKVLNEAKTNTVSKF